MELDHVVIAVGDLDAAARSFADRYGLDSVEGGRHPTLGTGNRIVPLGDAYLELVAVVDEELASQNEFGRTVGSVRGPAFRPICWVVRSHELDELAQRNGLAVTDGSRATPDGRVLRWRMAGLERAMAEPFLPFFIEWAPGTPHPGREPGADGPGRLEVRLRGDAVRLGSWIGDHDLPVTIEEGEPAVAGIVLGAGPESTVVEFP